MLKKTLTGLGWTVFFSFIVWVGFTLMGWADPEGWAAWRVGLLPAAAVLIIGGIATFLFVTGEL